MIIVELALAIILVVEILLLRHINLKLNMLIRDYDHSFFVLGRLISKLHPDKVQFRFCNTFWRDNGGLIIQETANDGKIIIISAVHIEK